MPLSVSADGACTTRFSPRNSSRSLRRTSVSYTLLNELNQKSYRRYGKLPEQLETEDGLRRWSRVREEFCCGVAQMEDKLELWKT